MLLKYSVDGSSLSISDRKKLIQILDKTAHTGAIFVDMEKGLYQAFFKILWMSLCSRFQTALL